MGNTQNGIRLRAMKWLQQNIDLNIFTQFDFSTQVMTFWLQTNGVISDKF
jgi:hypothetical protein